MNRENATWRIGKRELLAMAGGIVLYAATSWVSNFSLLSSGDAAGVIRPGVAVPVFFGFIYGPIVGLVVGLFGNFALDALVGWVSMPAAGSTFGQTMASLSANWEVGNGLLGFIPGLAALWRRRYLTLKEMGRAIAFIIAAVVIGMGFAAFLDPVVFSPANGFEGYYSGNYASDWLIALNDSFIPITITNLINALVLVPILLFNYERLDLKSLGSFTKSQLSRRLLIAILISAAIPIILLTIFLYQANLANAEAGGGSILIQLAFTIFMTAAFVITNAALVAQSITTPLLKLTAAASEMEAGNLGSDEAKKLKEHTGSDEIANLTRLFGDMSLEVIQREEKLRKQVEQLQIIVDEKKRADQVEEIVESDFFRELQAKAREMRQKSKR